jgi:hypothetical protein
MPHATDSQSLDNLKSPTDNVTCNRKAGARILGAVGEGVKPLWLPLSSGVFANPVEHCIDARWLIEGMTASISGKLSLWMSNAHNARFGSRCQSQSG